MVENFESVTDSFHSFCVVCCNWSWIISLMLLCSFISICWMLCWEVYVSVVDDCISITTGADFYVFNSSGAIVIDSFIWRFCNNLFSLFAILLIDSYKRDKLMFTCLLWCWKESVVVVGDFSYVCISLISTLLFIWFIDIFVFYYLYVFSVLLEGVCCCGCWISRLYLFCIVLC